ncbi:MAG: VCBS repeat-containing protein, partial [Sediminibacterium sp.]|nr:VCBS repeat-containing protein [Sediminibacterium sp.]
MRTIFLLLITSTLLIACNQQKPLYKEIKAEQSGIQFNNQITEDENLNVLNYEYIYNGGGVGIGDFNNDSLPDIYFAGNRVANKLYINKGKFKFEDITSSAGVDGNAKWCKGVSVIDINNDGWMDLYIAAAVLPDSNARKNVLYVNQGVNKSTGNPVFKEMAKEYGLDDASNTHMPAFFDYDNDGDLDVYLLINDLDGTYPNEFRPIRKDGSWPNTDKLFQNNWSNELKHPVFTDVSAKAGILIEGHGLGVSITDINNDGWKDIYVSNDYLSNNILYINNQNGTFTDRCAEYLKHTSKNAMGNDIVDINNDGLVDIIETDMTPIDNYRQKMMHGDMNYQTFQNSTRYGYQFQYPRNALQLNQGYSVKSNDSIGIPAFSEIAFLSGVAQTDWSWAPLLIDADNDGYRDLMVTNGLPKDMSDMDFMAYRKHAFAAASLQEVLAQLPTVKISNYIYQNNGDLSFTNKTK